MDVFESPDSTREEILAAAYRALCTHGYAELTMERIGEEFEKSVSLVYHHYDGKDDLLLACLEFMLERYQEETEAGRPDDPRAALEQFCDRVSVPDAPPEGRQFVRALVELQGQAPHTPAYRDYFTRSDRFFRRRLSTIIEAGTEDGTFREVDPERTAELLHTVLSGAFLRYATTEGEEWPGTLRAALRAHNERMLYAEEP
jgi:AcrR family transcriptional regulator